MNTTGKDSVVQTDNWVLERSRKHGEEVARLSVSGLLL